MSILIVEKSDIVRTGIRYILHELDKNLIVKDIVRAEKLRKTIEREKPYLVFLNPNLIPEQYQSDISKITKTKSKIVFVAIETCETPKNILGHFNEILNFTSSKDDIAKILRKYSLTETKTVLQETKNSELSNRERDVVKEIALGLTNKEIAEKLFLSIHTIVTHRKNITKKLGIKTTSGLTVYAIINNLIEIN